MLPEITPQNHHKLAFNYSNITLTNTTLDTFQFDHSRSCTDYKQCVPLV